MKTLVYLVLEKENKAFNQLKNFLTEFIRLSEKKASFIIGWKAGDRIYIYDSSNRPKKDVFACLDPTHLYDNKNAISVINYGISIKCDFDININININNNKLLFIISSDNDKKIELLNKFKKDLFSNF